MAARQKTYIVIQSVFSVGQENVDCFPFFFFKYHFYILKYTFLNPRDVLLCLVARLVPTFPSHSDSGTRCKNLFRGRRVCTQCRIKQ